jgi:hypothetical protein
MFERMFESSKLATVGGRASNVTARQPSRLPDRLFGYLGGAVLFFFG